MKRPSIYNFAAVLLFIAFVCGSILIIRKHEQKENFAKQLATVFSEKNKSFPVWKTMKLGPRQDIDTIRKELKSNSFSIEHWANDILSKTTETRNGRENRNLGQRIRLDLVRVSAGQLGFKDVATYQEIFKRAHELGLKSLPAEAGPQLRLQYPNQQENEWLHVGMQPIIASDGDPTVFDILHFDNHTHSDNGAHNPHGHSKQLCSSSVRSDVLWSPSSRWVFAKN